MGNPSSQTLSRFALPSIILTRFVPQFRLNLTRVLLADMALTFGVKVGTMGQIRTFASSITIVVALLLGFVSIRVSSKWLVMGGLALLGLSSLGCYLALDYPSMLILYSLGLGAALIVPMTTTMIGEHYPAEQRTGTLGWVLGIAQILLPGILGLPLIGFLATVGGWRFPFLAVALPVSVLSIALIAITIPSTPPQQRGFDVKGLLRGYSAVFSNRSAMTCLVGVALASASWQFFLAYGITFMRQVFQMSLDQVSLYSVIFTSAGFVGSLIAGRFVRRVGRKNTTVITLLVTAASIIMHFAVAQFLIAAVFSLIAAVFGVILLVSRVSLALEQAPEYRGTMMAMNGAANSVGGVIGAGVGGVLHTTLSSYVWIGIASLAIGLIAAMIFYRFVSEP